MKQKLIVAWGAAGAGLLTVILGLTIVLIMPSTANLTEGYRTPIIAFEFAKTEADLAFLTDSDPNGAENRDKIDRGHRWDMLFPVAYGLFLALLLIQMAQAGFKLGWLFVPFALFAIPFDLWENTILLSITASLRQGGTGTEFLGKLHIATWLKWGAIGLGAAGVGWGAWQKEEYWSAVLAIGTFLMTAISWLLGSQPFWVELMALMVFIFFLWFVMKQSVQLWQRGFAQGIAL